MPEQKRDYYDVLGLSKGASDEDIKRSFRKMAKEYHPDLHPGDKTAERRFKEVNEAYEVLSDRDKKSRYDQFGHAGVDPNFGAGGGFGDFSGFGGFADLDLGDILGSVFGGGFGGTSARSRTGPQRGENLRASVSISFEEAAFGCDREIAVNRTESCDACKGSGSEQGSEPESCPDCKGSGTIRVSRQTPMGTFSSSSTCSRCAGTGRIVRNPCKSCKGSGTTKKQRKISVHIPAGIADGQAISLRGQGGAGVRGGLAGDLLVGIRVREHELFARDGNSVLCELPVTFMQAALGAELEIPTLDGKVKYILPEGSQTGTTFRLKGKGIPSVNGRGRGDQYVTLFVEVPNNLTPAQKEALRKFGESLSESNHAKRKSFFEKFKR